jgi:hypothetical protein
MALSGDIYIGRKRSRPDCFNLRYEARGFKVKNLKNFGRKEAIVTKRQVKKDQRPKASRR